MAEPSMTPSLDALSYDLARKAQDAGDAAGDLSRLSRLGRVVADDLSGWLDRVAGLSCGTPCDLARAAILVLGSLFAETLDGPALRVLAAEMVRAMAEDGRIGSVPRDFI